MLQNMLDELMEWHVSLLDEIVTKKDDRFGAFGVINGVICVVTWRLHRSLKFNQVRSIAERSEAIINASQKDIEKLETLFKTDPYRDIENQKEEGIDSSIDNQKKAK